MKTPNIQRLIGRVSGMAEAFSLEAAEIAVKPFRDSLGLDGPSQSSMSAETKQALENVSRQFFDGYKQTIRDAFLAGAVGHAKLIMGIVSPEPLADYNIPRFGLGQRLKRFSTVPGCEGEGDVAAIFADLETLLEFGVVDEEWQKEHKDPAQDVEQIYYALYTMDMDEVSGAEIEGTLVAAESQLVSVLIPPQTQPKEIK